MIKMLSDMFDPYERKARLTPALLVALPIIVPLICIYGAKNPTLTAVVGLFSTCGVMYLLASVARGRGKKLEERLVKAWGGYPTTLILRHRDTFLDSVTKQRYHSAIGSKLGIKLPTLEQEQADWDAADNKYLGAVRLLREQTRGDKSLLLKENIAYGFHRNMLAMKGPGVFCCLLGLALGFVITGAVVAQPFGFAPSALLSPGIAGGLTIGVSSTLLLVWIFHLNSDTVRRIGFVYAERLFEKLESLDAPGTKRATARKARTPTNDTSAKEQ